MGHNSTGKERLTSLDQLRRPAADAHIPRCGLGTYWGGDNAGQGVCEGPTQERAADIKRAPARAGEAQLQVCAGSTTPGVLLLQDNGNLFVLEGRLVGARGRERNPAYEFTDGV